VKLSLVVPIYNEASHLDQFLTQIDALSLDADKELVFVDDCSKDNSWEILQQFKFKSKVIIERQPKNQAKALL